MRQVLLLGLGFAMLVKVSSAYCEPVAAETIPRVMPREQIAGPEILPNYLSNSSFEVDCCWDFPVTALPAKYSIKHAVSGVRSALTGALKAKQNRFSYSSVRQSVRIPGSASSAVLVFSLWQRTTESAQQAIPKPSEFDKTESAMSGDVQYVLILNQAGQRAVIVRRVRVRSTPMQIITAIRRCGKESRCLTMQHKLRSTCHCGNGRRNHR